MSGRLATPFEPLFDAAEGAQALDGVGKAVGKQVRSTIKQPLKDALSGTWLGHALHPLLTDVVVGTFLSATLLDLLGRVDDGIRRAGLVHAASNTTALLLYAGSRAARRNGARGRARALSLGGAGALM